MSASLEDVRIVAAGVFKPDHIDYWLSMPNELLEGRSPAFVIGQGEADRVLAVLDALAEGVTS